MRPLRSSRPADGSEQAGVVIWLDEQWAGELWSTEKEGQRGESFGCAKDTVRRISCALWDEATIGKLRLWLDDCLPENGARESYRQRAIEQAIREEREGREPGTIELLAANTGKEYPGAIGFTRPGEDPDEAGGGYERVSDAEIGARVEDAHVIAMGRGRTGLREYSGRGTSLSGMRGKIGIVWREGRGWCIPTGRSLSTWIVKHEDNRRLPGEAGVEAIVQRTMAYLGVPAAKTRSRVFAGVQSVLSERSDRKTREGTTVTVHQEEFSQAAGWPGTLKEETGLRGEPLWPALYTLLRQYGASEGQEQCERVTRLLAASWILGHGDLHRRNIGITHDLTHATPKIRLAPIYDASSCIGVGILRAELAIGIAKQKRLSGIGQRQWEAHARECGERREGVLTLVEEVMRNAPLALAQAREDARTEDENRVQTEVDRRVDGMLRYGQRRWREWRQRWRS